MKKFRLAMIIASVFAVVLGSFTFTSCDEPLVADENTWYSTKQTLQGATFKFYFYYSQEETKAGDVTLDPGITMIVVPTSMKGKLYAMKTFSKKANEQSEEVEVVDEVAEGEDGEGIPEEEKVTFKVSGTTMDLLYVYYKDDFKESESKKAPDLLYKDEGYTSVADIKELGEQLGLADLSWKQIVKEIVNAVL